MEKPTARIPRLWAGLLGCLLLPAALFAAPPRAYIDTLKFHKAGTYFFTQTDCQFTLDIEGVSPDRVVVFANNLPRNVSYTASRKENYVPPAASRSSRLGTHLVVSFRFDKPGSYQISPLEVRIEGMYCTIPLDAVYVYENPSTVQPQMYINFERPSGVAGRTKFSVRAEEHISFTLYIRYAVQIVNFSYGVPEDSLFREVERYAITQGIPRGSEFSPDAVPVATFDWQPLAAGDYAMPRITVVATSYSGIRYNVACPDYAITVLPPVPAQKAPPAQRTGALEGAFAPADGTEDAGVRLPADAPARNLELLLDLHQRERHSLPFVTSATRERQEAEALAGLTPGGAEPSVPLFWLLVALAVVFLGGAAIAFALKRLPTGAACVFLGIACAALAVACGGRVRRTFAILAVGEANAIPETNVQTRVQMPVGCRVLVERRAGTWAFIRYRESYGWVTDDNLYFIQ